jgi:beta-galactosidase
MLLKDTTKINDNWTFNLGDCSDYAYAATDFDDKKWEKVKLPHDWDTFFAPDKKSKSGAGGGYAKGGIGWYRKIITISKKDLKKRHELIFEGVYMESEVFANGILVGKRAYGYSTFVVDITDAVIEGDNIVAVKVNNSKLPNSRWYTGSGIYRDVYYRKTDSVCLDYFGVKADTSGVYREGLSATIDVRTLVNNYSEDDSDVQVKWILKDKRRKQVASAGATLYTSSFDSSEACSRIYVDNPSLWSCETPYLYKLVTQLYKGDEKIDERVDGFGIRTAEFTPSDGFSLNGVRTKIKGVCLHHDSGLFGAAFHKEIWEYRLKLLKEMGVNGIRCSHNPPAPALLDLCDELGFVVMDEIYDEWTLGKNKNENYFSDQPSYGFSQFFYQDAEQELRTMLRRDYNHPSIILWSIGNEIPEQAYSDGAKIVKFLSDIVHSEDSLRLVTSACDNIASLPEIETRKDFIDALEVVGYNYVGRWRERAESFYEEDKLANPDRIMIGTENPSVCGDRGDYSTDNKYNFSYVTAPLTHEALWRFTASRNYVAGDFIWTGIDYLGEAHWPRRGANFGAIDTANFKKDAFYYFKSIWNKDEVTLHLLPHWNFEGEEGQFKQVLCYTNCEKVKLFINDRLVGEKACAACPRYGATKSWDDEVRRYHPTTGDLHLSWDVPYEKGTLRAEGYIGNKRVKTTIVQTAKEADRLLAEVKQLGDFYYIEVSACDADLSVVPTARNIIKVKPDRNAELVGMDAGDMSDLTSYKSDKRAMLAGKILVVIKKKDTKKPVEVHIDADELKGLELKL